MTTPAVTVASFRQSFPAFQDITLFPDPMVDFWLSAADLMLTTRWPNTPKTDGGPTMRTMGISYFTAHNLTLQRQAADEANSRGDPGLHTGTISQRTIGPTTESYDSANTVSLGAEHWNLTTFGVQFIRLAKFVGAGPLQFGGECSAYFAASSALGAWPGPWPWPSPTGFS